MLGDSLLSSFNSSQYAISVNLEGVSNQESLRPPTPGGNCVNWIVGHILSSRGRILALLGGAPFLAETEAALYKRGSSAILPDSPHLPLERLREGLEVTAGQIAVLLKQKQPAEFEELMDPKVFPMPVETPSRGNLLTFLLYHEGYHAGQLGLARRLSGRPGAIR